MKILLYRLLARLFYYAGDVLCHVPCDTAYSLYRKSIMLSIKYDDISGNTIWKELNE